MFDRFKESRLQPLSAATVTLSDASIELYGASLTVTARLMGLRYYMYHWFWTAALLGVGAILVGEALFVAFVYLFYTLTAPPAESGASEVSEGAANAERVRSRSTADRGGSGMDNDGAEAAATESVPPPSTSSVGDDHRQDDSESDDTEGDHSRGASGGRGGDGDSDYEDESRGRTSRSSSASSSHSS